MNLILVRGIGLTKGLFLVSVFFVFINFIGYASITIDGEVDRGDTVSIEYYKPLNGFANYLLKAEYGSRVTGHFTLSFDVDHPIMIRLVFDHSRLDLLCEPHDTIRLKVSSPSKNRKKWISIQGNNAPGHYYYNTIYNDNLFKKFNEVRSVFDSNYLKSTDTLMKQIEMEFA